MTDVLDGSGTHQSFRRRKLRSPHRAFEVPLVILGKLVNFSPGIPTRRLGVHRLESGQSLRLIRAESALGLLAIAGHVYAALHLTMHSFDDRCASARFEGVAV